MFLVCFIKTHVTQLIQLQYTFHNKEGAGWNRRGNNDKKEQCDVENFHSAFFFFQNLLSLGVRTVFLYPPLPRGITVTIRYNYLHLHLPPLPPAPPVVKVILTRSGSSQRRTEPRWRKKKSFWLVVTWAGTSTDQIQHPQSPFEVEDNVTSNGDAS